MNKIVKMAMFFVALTATFSFAGYGFRAGFNLYDYSTGDSEVDKYINMGYGFGGGLVVNTPLSSYLSYVQEANFLYRKPVIVDFKDVLGYEGWVTEYVLSTPIMFQLTLAESIPYFAAGVQLDIPISSKTTIKPQGGKEESEDTENRASIDFGVVLGIGYLINPNVGVDVRAVISLTEPIKNGEDSWNLYGAGLTYYF